MVVGDGDDKFPENSGTHTATFHEIKLYNVIQTRYFLVLEYYCLVFKMD